MSAFLATSDFDGLSSFLFPIIIVSITMSIPIVSIITDHLQKKERLRLVEKAIEHGVDLKDLDVEEPQGCPRLPYRSGMILVAVGIALFSGHIILADRFGDIHLPLTVGGLITGLIGIAMLLNDYVNRDRMAKEATSLK